MERSSRRAMLAPPAELEEWEIEKVSHVQSLPQCFRIDLFRGKYPICLSLGGPLPRAEDSLLFLLSRSDQPWTRCRPAEEIFQLLVEKVTRRSISKTVNRLALN